MADDVLGREREDPRLPLDPLYLAAFDAIEADPNQLLAVAVLGAQVLGTLHLTLIPALGRLGSWRGQIEAVRISSNHRDIGLGGRMMRWAIEECRRRGCRLVQLTTAKGRPDAHRFHERLGFVPTPIGYKLVLQVTPQEGSAEAASDILGHQSPTLSGTPGLVEVQGSAVWRGLLQAL